MNGKTLFRHRPKLGTDMVRFANVRRLREGMSLTEFLDEFESDEMEKDQDRSDAAGEPILR